MSPNLKPTFKLTSLSADPAKTAILSFKKPIPYLIGTHRMNVLIHKNSTACVVFEICDPLEDARIYVDAKHNVNIIRDGYRWPMRLMPTAMGVQMNSYPEEAKPGLARIKPVQSALSGGYLGLEAVVPSRAILKFAAGQTTLLNNEEARHRLENYELMSTCDFGCNEWRAILPILELKQHYEIHSQNG